MGSPDREVRARKPREEEKGRAVPRRGGEGSGSESPPSVHLQVQPLLGRVRAYRPEDEQKGEPRNEAGSNNPGTRSTERNTHFQAPPSLGLMKGVEQGPQSCRS